MQFLTKSTNTPIAQIRKVQPNAGYIFLSQWKLHDDWMTITYSSWIHTQMLSIFFIAHLHAPFRFWGQEHLSGNRYQNAIPRAMPPHVLKQVQLQERFMLMTHNSIGHLKMLCMSILSLSGGVESEWKRYSSPLLNAEKILSV